MSETTPIPDADSQCFMWFTRYGSSHLEVRDSIEDCYELAWMLEDCDSSTFDQYGCLDVVEKVGHGVIDEDAFDAGLEAHKARRHAEHEERVARGDIARPVGCVEIFPPTSNPRFNAWVEAGTAYTDEALRIREAELIAALGADRVRTRIYKTAS